MLTRVLVHVFLDRVLVLVNPFPVALEENLQGGCGTAPQADRVALDDIGVFWLLQEVRQRPADGGRVGNGVSRSSWEETAELGSVEIMKNSGKTQS